MSAALLSGLRRAAVVSRAASLRPAAAALPVQRVAVRQMSSAHGPPDPTPHTPEEKKSEDTSEHNAAPNASNADSAAVEHDTESRRRSSDDDDRDRTFYGYGLVAIGVFGFIHLCSRGGSEDEAPKKQPKH